MPPSRTALERNIRLFYLLRLLRYLQVWLPVWVVYLTVEQGFSLTQVTTADGLFFVAVTLLEVPTGAVADRWGRSVSLGLGALSLAVALLVFAFTTSYTILLASFMVWALAETLSSGADLALLYDTLKALGREHEYERHA
ncbi:MAG: MFS transporter, partial [Dehalococcoidia bacterium]